jgi:cytochrome b561
MGASRLTTQFCYNAEWHTFTKLVFIGLIALHLAASLYHQFWRKDGLLMHMLKPN